MSFPMQIGDRKCSCLEVAVTGASWNNFNCSRRQSDLTPWRSCIFRGPRCTLTFHLPSTHLNYREISVADFPVLLHDEWFWNCMCSNIWWNDLYIHGVSSAQPLRMASHHLLSTVGGCTNRVLANRVFACMTSAIFVIFVIFIICVGFRSLMSKPLVFPDRMYIRHFHHFRQNPLCLEGSITPRLHPPETACKRLLCKRPCPGKSTVPVTFLCA